MFNNKEKNDTIDEEIIDKLFRRIDDKLDNFLSQINICKSEENVIIEGKQSEKECYYDLDKEKKSQCDPGKKEENRLTEVVDKYNDVFLRFEKILVEKLSNLNNDIKKISLIEEMFVDFKSLMCDKLIENDKIENVLIDKNSIIQSYQEDVYKKLTSPLIKQFIFLSDMMTRVTQEDKTGEENNYWENQFKEVINSILFILKDFSVNYYVEALDGEPFNPNRQEVVATKETTDETLDKKISRSLLPGFTWELPYILRPKVNGEKHLQTAYEFILRKEQIETYKYVK